MTENKQIMIHGADVSRCKFFAEDYKEDDIHFKNFCGLHYISCKEFDCAKCYFKQLARKERECEEWKHQAELGSDTTDRLAKQLEEKEQECKELKNNNNILKEHSRYYKNEGKRYKKEIGRLKASKEQAEQKLERIRNITEKDFCHTCWKTYQNQLKQILQIIDEEEQ